MDPVTGVLLGSAITGGLGAIGGYYEGKAKNREAKRAREDLDAAWQKYNLTQGNNLTGLNALINQYDPSKYGAMVTDAYDNGKGQYTAGKHTAADVNQWLDPNVEYRIQRASDAIENSAAGRNALLSGATQQAIADRSQKIAQEAWDNAVGASQNAFNANESAKQAEASSKQNAINNILSMYNSNLGARTTLEGRKVDIGQNMADQTMNYGGTKANLRTGTNAWSNAFSGGLQGISPWASAAGTAFGQKD